MKDYIKMLIFVFVLGAVTSTLLLTMDYLTKDRIEKNKEAALMSAILDAYEIPYSFNNVFVVFGDNVVTYELNGYTFYENIATKEVSYLFEGSAVWGPLVGIVTLEADFRTIVKISILEQEETPGLGGVIAEEQYLETFEGIILSESAPYIMLRHGSGENLPNEVDAITGGTRTSEAFERIFNDYYETVKPIWEGRAQS